MGLNSFQRSARTCQTGNHRWRWREATPAFLSALAVGLAVSAQAEGGQTAPSASDAPPPLPFKTTVLPNGLTVVTLEDHHAPVVTLEIYYLVGSKDENPGRFGFAHLFEHLMFKGSKNVASEAHAHFVEQLGGQYSADTGFDRTRFYETVPVNALNRVLYLEADRMATLNVDQPNLDSERKVVEEEYRLRIANSPYGLIDEPLQALIYPAGHPYAHDSIGSIHDLDAATLAEVRAFHDTFYKPDNAILVLVGDIRTQDALERVRRYFGSIPARGKPVPRRPTPALDPGAGRKLVLPAPLAPTPMVVMAYPAPTPSSPDTPALELLATVLSEGRNSRFFHSLVKTAMLSARPSAEMNQMLLGGYFLIQADVVAGHTSDEVEKAINVELDKLRKKPVGDEELAKAKNLALNGLVFSSETTDECAERLSEAVLLFGSADITNQSYTRINSVTSADIMRVAKTYLTPERARVVFATPPAVPAPASATQAAQ